MPQPIETAPRNGAVILTELGFVQYDLGRRRWAECAPSGYIYTCADNGDYYCYPKYWEPIPVWMEK